MLLIPNGPEISLVELLVKDLTLLGDASNNGLRPGGEDNLRRN